MYPMLRQVRLSGTYMLHEFPVEDFNLLKSHLQKNVVSKYRKNGNSVFRSYFHESDIWKDKSVFEDSEFVIDLEVCPVCSSVSRVYDCTSDLCQYLFEVQQFYFLFFYS
jgi:hypothetical protein